MKTKRLTAMAWLAALSCNFVYAQNIAYEGFTGIPSGSALTETGINSSGWLDAGWNLASNQRILVSSEPPALSYQIPAGGFVDGGSNSLALRTSPEPTGDADVAIRHIAPQNATIWMSFLIRPIQIGTGSDSFDILFKSNGTTYGKFSIQLDQSGTYMNCNSVGNSITIRAGNLSAGNTYLIVIRYTRPTASQFGLLHWINPRATYSTPTSTPATGYIPSDSNIDQIGIKVSSNDISGPTSEIRLDEIRLGYKWEDVVLPLPVQGTVPALEINQAVQLRWQTTSSNRYQIQTSYDLINWTNIGTEYIGDGTIKEVYEALDTNHKRFWRVQIK